MFSSDKILTPAEYGSIFVPSYQAAQARGSGNWNPPPIWQQSTNRGYAWENSYPMYTQKNAQNHLDPQSPEPIDVNNLDLAHFNTPSDLGDNLRKRAYLVGSTGLYDDKPGSWGRPEFEGAQNQYVEWALKAFGFAGITPTPLMVYFFSTDNVNYLQERTKKEVAKHKGQNINDQSIDELLIIMLNHAIYAYEGWLPSVPPEGVGRNGLSVITDRGEKPCSLEERLSRLNKSVIEETVKQVFSGINMYQQYIKDKSSLPMPLDLPVYTSMAGSKELSPSIGFNSGLERTIAAQSFNQRYNII